MGHTTEAGREQYALGPQAEVAIARTRAQVASASAELRGGGASAQVSARVPGAGLFVIEPRQAGADRVAADVTVLCDLQAQVVTGTPGSEDRPAGDAAFHASLYRDSDAVGGIVSVAGSAAALLTATPTISEAAAHARVVSAQAAAAVVAGSVEVAVSTALRLLAPNTSVD